MGGGRDHAQIKIESREDVVARSLARSRACAVDFLYCKRHSRASTALERARMPRAKKSTRETTVNARVESDASTRISAPRDEALERAWKIYNRHRERISRSTFARCEEESGYSEFDELGVRVSASSVAERALSAEVKTLED